MRDGRIPRVVAAILLAGSLAVAARSNARADEGGVAFWLSGSYSSFAAVPQQAGWYMPTQLYYYNGSASGTKSFQRGDALEVGVSSQAALVFFTPTWVPDEKWFGGHPSCSLTFGGGSNSTSTDLSLSTLRPGTLTANRSDSDSGGADLYPQAQIAWTSGNDNWMAYITGDLPVGSYSSTRMSNIGLGHTALDIGGAYTYSNNTSGFEASATLGFTYNGMNTSTNYQSGVDSHLDWEVSQFLSQNWELGVVGYVYYQLSGDSGSGDHVGSFKSRRRHRPRGGVCIYRRRPAVVREPAWLLGVLGREPASGLRHFRDAEHPPRQRPQEDADNGRRGRGASARRGEHTRREVVAQHYDLLVPTQSLRDHDLSAPEGYGR